MTLRDMIDMFQGSIDDYQSAFWDDAKATTLVNRMQGILQQEFAITVQRYYTFLSVDGQQHYQMPDRYVANHLLYYNDAGLTQEIVIKDSPKSIYTQHYPVTTEGYPTKAFIWGASGRRQLTIYPTFNKDGVTMEWWFWGLPPNLSRDNDESMLPQEWHQSLVELMIAQAKADDHHISVGDNLIIRKDEVGKLKRLDVTKTIEERGGQYGTIDGVFPRIDESDPLDFRVQFRGGGVA